MKKLNKLKWLGFAAIPTIASLHCRWIAHLLSIEWDTEAKAFAVITVTIVSIIAAAGVAADLHSSR